ncbi:chromobox protein 1 [Chrysochromulina tobinii]|uniref:Chromobox protein 1 n=1 Tax=Chrysochromulina tobinii TaxID=1460289 RepID=A0A0M0JN25_9EUKA|nr:chromobox protein 1 [Chrysochromulina tobinii]|eukprot:KOO27663.1 chromobox protein 1 [Chrysochromulina sp. CCMP291]
MEQSEEAAAAAAASEAAARAWTGICRLTEKCVLQSGHEGECRIGAMEEQDYEVEKILAQRQRGRKVEYLIKWLNWPDEDSTWEPASALTECPEIFAAWNEANPAPPARSSSTASAASSTSGDRKKKKQQQPAVEPADASAASLAAGVCGKPSQPFAGSPPSASLPLPRSASTTSAASRGGDPEREELDSARVDRMLFEGASASGWRILEAHKGSAKKAQWKYLAPSGMTYTSKGQVALHIQETLGLQAMATPEATLEAPRLPGSQAQLATQPGGSAPSEEAPLALATASLRVALAAAVASVAAAEGVLPAHEGVLPAHEGAMSAHESAMSAHEDAAAEGVLPAHEGASKRATNGSATHGSHASECAGRRDSAHDGGTGTGTGTCTGTGTSTCTGTGIGGGR